MWLWDILVLETLVPWDSWPLSSSTTSSYFHLPPPISSSNSSPLVWFGMGGGVEFWQWRLRWTIGDWPLTFILMLKSYGWWWWVVVYLDYNDSSGPFLSYEIEIGDGPGPELDNYWKQFVTGCTSWCNL